MYSKNLIRFAPLFVIIAACSSTPQSDDDSSAGKGGAGGSTGGSSPSAGKGGSVTGTGGSTGGTGGSTGGTGGSTGGTGGSTGGTGGSTGGTGGSTGGTGGSTGGTGGSTGGTGGSLPMAGAPGSGGGMPMGGAGPMGGAPGAGGMSAGGATHGGSGGSGGGVMPTNSDLPPAPGMANVPQPNGTPGNLTVINWAGFKGAVTYSFDDDNDSQIQHYSELQAAGGQYTFYMWTNRSEAKNSIWGQALKDGHEIGNHTMSHDSNGHCTLDDINQATSFIQSQWNTKAWTMAAPNGSSCFEAPAKMVFFINRGVSPAKPVMPLDTADPTNLNCYIPAQGQAVGTFNNDVDSAEKAGGWVIYVVHGFTGGNDGAYQPVDISAMTGAIQHSKSLGDMWLGSMVNVASYWLGQKAVKAAMTSTSGSDTTYTWTLPQFFPTGKYVRIKVDGGTVKQNGQALAWDPHGYYEIALDAKSLTLSP